MNDPDRPSLAATMPGLGPGLDRTDSLEERLDLEVVVVAGRSVVESVL